MCSVCLMQAGFPCEGILSPDVTVSEPQWQEFCGQFQNVLTLLRQIATVWNMEEPCVISSFDMDRQGTVQVGTRVPRFVSLVSMYEYAGGNCRGQRVAKTMCVYCACVCECVWSPAAAGRAILALLVFTSAFSA